MLFRVIKKLTAAFVLAACWFGSPTSALAQEGPVLYLPILQSTDRGQTGLAFSNPTLAEVTVTLTARNYSGSVIAGPAITNPVTVSVPPSGQFARLASELFGSGIGGNTGWVEIRTANSSLRGFFTVFDALLTQLDCAEFQTAGSSRIVFPKASTVPGAVTTITFANTANDSTTTIITLYDNAGRVTAQRSLPLGPYAGFSGPLTQLLPGSQPVDGYAVIERAGPAAGESNSLIGFESYSLQGDMAVINALPVSAQLRTGYMAHLAAQGGYRTKVALVNYSQTPQVVTITAGGLETSTGPLAQASVNVLRVIPPFARVEESADQMFNLSGTALISGYVTWSTQGQTNGVIGYIEYGTTDGRALSVVPAQGTPLSDLFFSHIAEGQGYYTGIALLNPNASSSTVSLEATNLQGQSVAARTIVLAAGERRARVLSEVFGGFPAQFGGALRVTATQPVFAFQLFGSSSGSFLANVSAQGVQLQPQITGTPVAAATGGIVLAAGSLSSIAIPPGALSADTSITLLPLPYSPREPLPDQKMIGEVQALPTGVQFQIPVRLTFPLSAQWNPGAKIRLLVLDESTNLFTDSGSDAVVDDSGRSASALVTHFSTYGVAVPAAQIFDLGGLNPASGAPGGTVTITGSGFSTVPSENVVTLPGSTVPVIQATVVAATPTQLSVTVPQGAVSGDLVVRVGGKTSRGLRLTVVSDKRTPSLSAVFPGSVVSGSPAFSVTATGRDFDPSSYLTVDQVSLPTTVVDSTRIVSTFFGNAAVLGVHRVAVVSPPPGGGSSLEREFIVGYPAPAIFSITPSDAESGTTPTTVRISGSGFSSTSVVLLNSVPVTSTLVSTDTIDAFLSSVTPGAASVAVSNPSPGGGISNAAIFNFSGTAATNIALISQSAASAPVGTGVSVTLELRGPDGQPLPQKTATLQVIQGGGSIPALATSDSNGRIVTTVVLGTAVGLNRFLVTAGSATLNIDVTGVAGAPTQLLRVSGNGQAAPVESLLPHPLVVEARDQFNNLVSGIAVAFTVTPVNTGAFVTPAGPLTTGTDGRVQVTATLGSAGIVYQFTASAGAVAIDFTAVGTLGADTVLKVAGNNQTAAPGVSLLTPLRVRVAFGGIPIQNLAVHWTATSGGGSVSSPTSITDSNGEATVIATVGPTEAINTFMATAEGVTGTTFVATAKMLSLTPPHVTVNISSGPSIIGAYQVTIAFNKDVVTLAPGSVLGGTGAGFTGKPSTLVIDNQAGVVTISHTQTGNSPLGDFSVANLLFTPIRAGTSDLTLAAVTVTNTQGQGIPPIVVSLSAPSVVAN